jgi:hypothetical protein
VREARPGARNLFPGRGERSQAGVEGQGSQSDDGRIAREQRELSLQVHAAVGELRGEGTVAGRSAPDCGGDQNTAESQPVARPFRLGLVREACLVECAKQEVARFVAGEDSPGAIASVSGRRKADQEDPGTGIAEGGKGSRPVGLAPESAGSVDGSELAPGDEPRAPAAGDDLAFELAETVGRPRYLREYLPIRAPSATMCPFIARSRSALVALDESFSSVSSA